MGRGVSFDTLVEVPLSLERAGEGMSHLLLPTAGLSSGSQEERDGVRTSVRGWERGRAGIDFKNVPHYIEWRQMAVYCFTFLDI